MVLALLKLGFRIEEIMGMTEAEAEGYLSTYEEIVSPRQKEKTYVVKREPEG